MRWHYRDPLLIWLLPAAYACHVLEEWFGGFTVWMANVTGAPVPTGAFVAINAVALALALAAASETTRRESAGWMGIAIATILLINAAAHIGGTLAYRSYSPGLVTGVILYLPLSQLVLLRAASQADRRLVGRGMLAGVALHAVVGVIVFVVTRRAAAA